MTDAKIHFHDKPVAEIAAHFKAIIELLGEDPQREGLVRTPERAAKALLENTCGYDQDPRAIIRAAMFEHPGSELVIVRDIEFYSLCEHHILPFFGKVSIGYLPDGKIVGLSKLARVDNSFARRLQVQERLTAEVCDLLSDELSGRGVIVHCRAQHLCMKMRGVENQSAETVTLHYSGAFANDAALRSQFLTLLS